MAVALVDGAVGRQEVKVLAAFRIPDIDALSLGEDDGERVVVVSRILFLTGDGGISGRGMEAGCSAVAGNSIASVGSHGWRELIVCVGENEV